METIRVNMTPCEDIKTIHASQNDNEGREWGFELHNNGEKIDSSSISDQLVFKAYEGGTEEILPENGSTPTTSPFLGDIKYPQGLLSDQEFLYRESPTEEDGLAWIKNIKGNTLVWNQLVQNGNFADTSNWRTEYSATISASNNVLSLTPTAQNGRVSQSFTYIANHKLLIMADVKLSSTSGTFDLVSLSAYAIDNRAQTSTQRPISSTNWQKLYAFCYSTSTNANNRFMYTDGRTSDWGTTQIRNFMAFDLTSMFGEAKANELFASEQSQVGKGLLEFTSLFPLPYYSYNQGTLLSFMGNGIKTVGKNLIEGISQGAVGTHGETNTNANRLRVDGFVRVLQGEQYTFSASKSASTNLQIYTRFFADNDGSEQISYLDWLTLPRTITIPNGINYATFTIRYQTSTAITPSDIYDVQLEIGASATDFEPYTSSTLSLPISTYFPNGMKSAGSVYDELTETKAITRIGMVDLGSLNWVYNSNYGMYTTGIASLIKRPSSATTKANIVCAIRETDTWSAVFNAGTSGGKCGVTTTGEFGMSTTETNPSAFKASLNNVYLYYELATESETSFTTASLVTENVEIPLSNEDGTLIGKCTEQLSSESGFFDAKIKLADEDGECYSNKLQLHIERSPQ